jgi:RNA polymerase sigma-70 factor (ECF subfamily)
MAEPDMADALPATALAAVEGASLPGHDTMSEAQFRALYQETSGPLLNYLRRLTGNSAQAEDLLQESYYRVLRAAPGELEPGQRKSYLYRTATNLARDHFRRRRFEPAELDETLPARPAAAPGTAPDVAGVLAQVKPNERALAWLAYVEGLSHREIAAATGIKEASVRPLLYRVRQKLAGLLRERGYGGGVAR